jgi:hypothetical protein
MSFSRRTIRAVFSVHDPAFIQFKAFVEQIGNARRPLWEHAVRQDAPCQPAVAGGS